MGATSNLQFAGPGLPHPVPCGVTEMLIIANVRRFRCARFSPRLAVASIGIDGGLTLGLGCRYPRHVPSGVDLLDGLINETTVSIVRHAEWVGPAVGLLTFSQLPEPVALLIPAAALIPSIVSRAIIAAALGGWLSFRPYRRIGAFASADGTSTRIVMRRAHQGLLPSFREGLLPDPGVFAGGFAQSREFARFLKLPPNRGM